RRMVSQYPWLYERAGLFAWRPARQSRHDRGQDQEKPAAEGRLPP
ncbi:MAG: DUF6867 family protein, partial [Bacteroidota bacterium]